MLTGLPDDLYEVILVDGNSTDGTAAVARQVSPDISIMGQTRRGKGKRPSLWIRCSNWRFYRDARCRRVDRSGGDPKVCQHAEGENRFCQRFAFYGGSGK